MDILYALRDYGESQVLLISTCMNSLLKQLIFSKFLFLIVSAVSPAAIISVVLTDDGGVTREIAPATEAGADLGLTTTSGAATNWNNLRAEDVVDNMPRNGFTDETGTDVSADFSITFQDNDGFRQNSTANSPSAAIGYNGVRLFDHLAAGASFLTLTDTEAIFGSTPFDLYLYLARAQPQTSATYSMEARVNGQPATLQSLTGVTGSTLVTNTTPPAGAYLEGTQFLRLSGIATSSGDITIDIAGTSTGSQNFSALGAVQLVAIPEPSSLALIALGIGALFVLRRR